MDESDESSEAARATEREHLWAVFEGKWTFHILHGLTDGPLHYNAIRRQLGIPGSTLSKRLETVQEYGIVTRTVKDTSPPIVEYSLTEKGREIAVVIDRLSEIERELAS